MLTKLSKRLEGISFEDIPEKTAHKTKIAILNFIGGSLPGADAQATIAEKALWDKQRSQGVCSIIGGVDKTSPVAAAAVNAAMGQVFLQEDCHERTLSHPGVSVVPAALAVGQDLGISGKRFIEAVAAGYEAQGRVGIGLIKKGFPKNGLRPASFVAPFGSAAAAAFAMGLGADGIAGALSIAANTASGVMEFVNTGTPDICIQNCFAAKNGVMAAYMAFGGITASPAVLNGRFGLGLALNNSECDWGGLDYDGDYIIDDTFIKIYPGCGHVLATAQAAEAIVREHGILPGDVAGVVVGVSEGGGSFPGVDNQGPFGGVISAMMSHQFMVASALVRGEVSIRTVKEFGDPEIAAMAKRVTVVIDEEANAQTHKTGARVTVTLKNAAVLSNYEEDIIPQSDEGVKNRLRDYGRAFFSDSRIEEIIEKTMNLEKLTDVGELAELLLTDKA